jgi:prepilin-type N-terminal cleavage/methylation domain-containing protein/prepilin-type processing-associated H-X9-DG protein
MRKSKYRNNMKCGFTLIELLVVVTIISVIIMLLLPAVQAARESSRRALCANNLKQIGIALSSYESSHGSFPLGGVTRLGVTRLIGETPEINGLGYANNLSWRALILSQLEQIPLYNRINFSVPIDSAGPDKWAGITLWKTSVGVFLCPSDSGHEDGFRPSGTDYGQYVFTAPPIDPATGQSAAETPVASYDGSFGDNYSVTTLNPSSPWETPCGVDPPPGHPRIGWPGYWGTTYGCDITLGRDQGGKLRGIFDSRTGQITRMHGITDGVSSTIMVGETLPAQRADNNFWNYNGAVAGTAIPMNLLTERAACADGKTWPTLDIGCRFSDAAAGFKSEHPGGVNFLFCDGSVRFLKTGISPAVYAALGSKAGGESVSADAY